MNKLTIAGEIGWDITAKEFKNQLNGVSGDIDIDINTVGGSITQGVEMFNAMSNYDRGSITTTNVGLCASMGSYLLLAGDTIKAYDNSIYMVHNALTFEYGNQHAMRKTADRLEALSDMLGKMYIKKTGKSKEEVTKMMDDETYLFGDEMLTEGFVDEMIIVSSNDQAKTKDSAISDLSAIMVTTQKSAKEHCNSDGYCNFEKMVASMPTEPTNVVADKIVENTTKEDDMDKVIAQADFDTIKASLETATTNISALENANATLKSDLATAKDGIEGASALATVKVEIVAMAYTHNVSKEVALAMLEKDTVAEAGLVALEAKQTNASQTPQGDIDDNQDEAEAKAMADYAKENAGRIR